MRTGALEKCSNTRFAETMQWAMDVISNDGLDPLGVGYRSTIHVRLIHAFVRRHVAAMPDWRSDEWGVPVNQTDMAATVAALSNPDESTKQLPFPIADNPLVWHDRSMPGRWCRSRSTSPEASPP